MEKGRDAKFGISSYHLAKAHIRPNAVKVKRIPEVLSQPPVNAILVLHNKI